MKIRIATTLGIFVLMAEMMNVLLAAPVSLGSDKDYVRAAAGTNALNVILANCAGTNVEVSVVADVDTVTLSSISGLEKVIAEGGADCHANERGVFPVGHYRVSLLVRATLLGDTLANRLVFSAKTDAANATVDGHWLFYRGMTLKVGLRKTRDGFSICRIEPVLPYPPYTTDNVIVYEKKIPATSRFSLIGRWFDAVERGRVTILYGDHTRVDYFSDRNLIEGYCGTLPDFGAHAWLQVWTHGKDARLDYWRNAWFADVQSRRLVQDDPKSEAPLFQPAMSAWFYREEDRLLFNWWNIVFPSVSFKSPATMKDVADFFTQATRPCSCTDDVACRVVADQSVAARPIRPLVVSNVGAWEVLQRVASENGCAIKVDGTNVTLFAELTDAEVATPCVDELVAMLEKEGFASAAGARYADVSFRSFGEVRTLEDREVVPDIGLYRIDDPESSMEGNGWVRTAADGTEQFLAYDANWWDAPKGDRSNEKDEDLFCFDSTKVRFRRDFFRSLDTLTLLAEGTFGWGYRFKQEEYDTNYLVFALHAAQAGFKVEAQQLVDALWRRPADAKKALTKLRERIGKPEAKCRTAHEWYLLMQSKAKEQAKEKNKVQDKEVDDDSDAN